MTGGNHATVYLPQQAVERLIDLLSRCQVTIEQTSKERHKDTDRQLVIRLSRARAWLADRLAEFPA